MAFDGLTAKSVCNELDCLIGGKITKIFEPNKNEIILGVYSNSSNYALNISIDSSLYRLNLTTYNKPNPQNVLGFCMVLRKHLTNGIIKNIYMNGFERIVYIDILTKNDLNDLTCKTLVVELMGKHSNIILLNGFQTVIDSLRHLNRFDNSNRDIFPGSKYASINNHKFEFSKTIEDFSRNIFDCNISPFSLSTAISTIYNGFSKNNLLALFDHININDEDNSYSNLKVVFDYLSNLTSSLLSGGTNNKLVEYSLKNKKDYFIASCETQSNLDVNFKLDNFYHQKEISDKFQQYKNLILKLVLNQISKLKNKIKNIDSKISECSNMDEYKLYGELLTSNLYRLSNIPIAEVSLENYYDKNNLITIPLDSRFSPAQNAKNFFKK